MSNNIFDREAAQRRLVEWGLWPVDGDGPYAAGVRDWWLRLLEKVTDVVGEHDWRNEEYPEDRYTEFTETAAEQMVAEARKARAVLRICDASELSKVFGPGHEEVEIRLLSLFESDGTEHTHRHTGESWEEYEERMAPLRQQHWEARKALLTLDGFTELYLTVAAVTVARAWCEQAVDTWYEANPEPDEDE